MFDWIAKVASGKFGVLKLIIAFLIVVAVIAIPYLAPATKEERASTGTTECSPSISDLKASGSITISNSGCNKK